MQEIKIVSSQRKMESETVTELTDIALLNFAEESTASTPTSDMASSLKFQKNHSTTAISTKAYFAFLWRIHFYAGIFIAPFILVAAITGTLYAVGTMIFPWSNSHLLHAKSLESTISLNQQIAMAQAAHPLWKLTKIQLNEGYENTTWVILQDQQHEEHAIFIDPYRGKILGDLAFKKNSIEILNWLDNLHRNLLLGNFGRLYSELAASWMWIIAMSGLSLWAYRFFTSHRSKSGRLNKKSRAKSFHTRSGIIVFLGMIFLSITGITWSHYAGDHVDALRAKLGWNKPEVKIPSQKRSQGIISTDYAKLADNIQRAGMSAPYLIILSNTNQKPIMVKEISKDYRMSRGILEIDPSRLEVIQNYAFDHFPFMAQLADWAVRIHMGNLFGLANRILLVLIGAGITAVSIFGYCMWWSRRGKYFPILPGSMFNGLSTQVKIGIISGACLFGYFLPLLGISLLIFCMIDAMRTWFTASTSPDS